MVIRNQKQSIVLMAMVGFFFMHSISILQATSFQITPCIGGNIWCTSIHKILESRMKKRYYRSTDIGLELGCMVRIPLVFGIFIQPKLLFMLCRGRDTIQNEGALNNKEWLKRYTILATGGISFLGLRLYAGGGLNSSFKEKKTEDFLTNVIKSFHNTETVTLLVVGTGMDIKKLMIDVCMRVDNSIKNFIPMRSENLRKDMPKYVGRHIGKYWIYTLSIGYNLL